MTFCTLSETNHALTAFSIREGVVFAEEVFMISASSRKIRTSSVAIAVSTPTPAVSEPDEKKEFLVVVDEGEGPSELVLLPTPKFKTRLFASDDAEEDAEDERLSAETIGDGTTNTGDGGGVGDVADAPESITTLFIHSLLLFSFAIDLSFLASSALS